MILAFSQGGKYNWATLLFPISVIHLGCYAAACSIYTRLFIKQPILRFWLWKTNKPWKTSAKSLTKPSRYSTSGSTLTIFLILVDVRVRGGRDQLICNFATEWLLWFTTLSWRVIFLGAHKNEKLQIDSSTTQTLSKAFLIVFRWGLTDFLLIAGKHIQYGNTGCGVFKRGIQN